MAKPTAPLFGFDARGSIGKAIVYSSWRGRSYTRRHVIPANPRTSSQTEVRGTFAWLQAEFQHMPALLSDIWTLAAKGRPVTNRNLFTRTNLPGLRGQTNLNNLSTSTGPNGGGSISSPTLTGGAGQVQIQNTPPTLPDGWTVTRMIGFVIVTQTPDGNLPDGFYEAAADTTSPYSVTITGLPAGTYYAGSIFQYLKPDGTVAYSFDSTGTAVVT